MVETANSENGAGASHPRNGLSRATCSTARRTITDSLSTLSTPLMFPLFVFVLFTPPAIQMLLQQPCLRFTLTDPRIALSNSTYDSRTQLGLLRLWPLAVHMSTAR